MHMGSARSLGEWMFSLQGYGPSILEGTVLTIEVSLASLMIAEPIKEKRNKENKPKSDLADIPPSGFVADQKSIIYFKHNSNDLEDKAFETLDRIADYVIENPEVNVSVEGYTDSSGSYSYNISVSQFRANTIKSYLVGKGVNSSQIAAKGLGPESPIATNNTEAGRTKNRRVEIKLDK